MARDSPSLDDEVPSEPRKVTDRRSVKSKRPTSKSEEKKIERTGTGEGGGSERGKLHLVSFPFHPFLMSMYPTPPGSGVFAQIRGKKLTRG